MRVLSAVGEPARAKRLGRSSASRRSIHPANFIDGGRLALMKPGASLINVSRADIVERNVLLEALRSGHLGGFALDPLYEEPGRQDDELLAFDNVILTPHMAGSPRSNGLRDMEELITGLAQALLE